MNSQKKLLSILHIVYGSLTLITLLIVNLALEVALPFIENEVSGDELRLIKTVFLFVHSLFFILIILFPLPSIVGGIAQLNGKKWGLTVMMISGCLSLLSVPVGTALGVFTIYVFTQSSKQEQND
ncbi:hypothetical protein [Marinoscillum pacificum]|uniref:hypothetical protein n=1 Tax=Marinoscillum pacificum TaxID=392723 RepID=UPI0021588D35|nr:hypothetical protein [Marinoscillum pacificum]